MNDLELFFKSCDDFILGVSCGMLRKTKAETVELLKKDKNYQVGLLHHFNHYYFPHFKKGLEQLIQKYKKLSTNVEFAFEVLKYDYSLIEEFASIANHPKIKLAALGKYPEKIKEYSDWDTEKKLIYAIKFNPIVYRYLTEQFKNNEKIIKILLSTTILHPQKETDTQIGMFFDIPQQYQENKNLIKLALKSYPRLLSHLPLSNREDHELIMIALKQGFYEKDMNAFYNLQNIIPYVDSKFFKEMNNIKWLMKGFQYNVEEATLNTDCAMLVFCHFMRESSKYIKEVKEFFETMGIIEKFENMLAKHRFKLYSDDIVPTGIEPEANRFFEEIFPKLSNKFEQYLLYRTLNNELSQVEKNENRNKI